MTPQQGSGKGPGKKGSGKAKGSSAGKGKPKPKPKPRAKKPEQPPRSDRTEEYELGDDFLSELDEEGAEEEPAAEDELVAEQGPEHEGPDDEELEEDGPEQDEDEDEQPADEDEDELTQVISAETQEWDGLEEAERQGEAEKTFVRSAAGAVAGAGSKARSAVTSGFEAVSGEKVTSGFKSIAGKLRFPLWARFLTAAFVIVLSVGTATAASLLLYIEEIAEDLKLAPEFQGLKPDLTAVDGGGPQTILILGSDKRPEFKGDKFRGLSDTTMLLRVDPDRNAIALFSLPRDLKVEIPGSGTAKLNEAYAYGGPELTLKTIKELTKVPATDNQGLEINHIVNVDFEGFARAVNAIGCVYVDVDRRYFHSNDETVEDYEEIDLQPGYQALCGFDALDYARYRHTDNDVVRAARQQDFLREARQKVPPEVVFADRKELIDIFTEHTTSDIDDAATMLQVLKLFVEARDAPVKEVHFEGTLGPSFVTTTTQEINKAVVQFLGIEDTPGQRGESAAPEDPVTPEAAPDESGVDPGGRQEEEGRGRRRGVRAADRDHLRQGAREGHPGPQGEAADLLPDRARGRHRLRPEAARLQDQRNRQGQPAELRARRLQVGLLAPGAGRVLRLHGDPLAGPADPQEPLRGARDRRARLQALLRRGPPEAGRLADRRRLLLAPQHVDPVPFGPRDDRHRQGDDRAAEARRGQLIAAPAATPSRPG